jgi:uncharacterized Zn finger protein (UPF0148 family)
MVPEISPRCAACGVSIREFGEGVLFCPECGQPLAPKQTKTNTEGGAAATVVDGVETPPAAAARRETDKSESRSNPAGDGPINAREKTRGPLHRASNVARGAIEDNVKRVEKIHQVSSVMIEEATYDPSLRFVLVAVGIFVLFVVLLVLSKVMG